MGGCGGRGGNKHSSLICLTARCRGSGVRVSFSLVSLPFHFHRLSRDTLRRLLLEVS